MSSSSCRRCEDDDVNDDDGDGRETMADSESIPRPTHGSYILNMPHTRTYTQQQAAPCPLHISNCERHGLRLVHLTFIHARARAETQQKHAALCGGTRTTCAHTHTHTFSHKLACASCCSHSHTRIRACSPVCASCTHIHKTCMCVCVYISRGV